MQAMPIPELRARHDHWRRQALGVDTDLEADLAEYFGLTPVQARLLGRLYIAGGNPCMTPSLALTIKVPTDSMRSFISSIRPALEPEAIDSARGVGYWLTEIGLAECQRAIDEGSGTAANQERAA